MFWKEFKVLSHHLPGEIKKNHGKEDSHTLLAPSLCGPLRALASLISAHSSLSPAFCHNLLTFISSSSF